jgi:hypothetical protein
MHVIPGGGENASLLLAQVVGADLFTDPFAPGSVGFFGGTDHCCMHDHVSPPLSFVVLDQVIMPPFLVIKFVSHTFLNSWSME